MKIFDITKSFPADEKYSLVSQIRRLSRGVCSAIAKAYRKRQYEAYFVNKISDADAENSETIVWLEFAKACKYINEKQEEELEALSDEVGRMLNSMMESPEKFQPKDKKPKIK